MSSYPFKSGFQSHLVLHTLFQADEIFVGMYMQSVVYTSYN